MPDKFEEWANKINKKEKADVVDKASDYKGLDVTRIPMRNIELDLALGGGIPLGRIVLSYGPQSSGKTVMATHGCYAISQFCFGCYRSAIDCTCEESSSGRALYVDSESAFDKDWASLNGFDPDLHYLFRPQYGEQAVDVIDDAIKEEVFQMIVLDSIAMNTPQVEIDKKTEEPIVGEHGRMMNKAFRKWVNSMVNAERPPILWCINQPRQDVGSMGDDLTLPGGKGQRFANSIELRMKSPKIKDHEDTNQAYVEISGTVKKNKTYIPNKPFCFNLALDKYWDYVPGESNHEESIVKYCRQLNLIKTSPKKGWSFLYPNEKGEEESIYAKNRDEMIKLLRENVEMSRYLEEKIKAQML